MIRRTIGVTALCGALSMSTLWVQPAAPAQAAPVSSANGPWMGLWKFNPEKTAAANNRPGPTGPAGERFFRMVPVGKDAFKYTIETTPPGGGPTAVVAELIGRFDGKDYIEIGNPGADTNKFRLVDSHTYELTDTKDGVDLASFRITISPDGKTRTSVAGGKTRDGKDVPRTISIHDRVQ